MAVNRIVAHPHRPRRRMMSSRYIESQLDMMLTIGDLKRAFDVADMTIHTWRRERALPTMIIKGDGRDTIRFHPVDVVQWAKDHHCVIVDKDALMVDRSTYRMMDEEAA